MTYKQVLLIFAVSLLAAAATAKPREYKLPADTVPAALAGPASEIIVNNCMGCHSLDYITSQPRGKGPQFWRDAVNKMVNVYGAPVDHADIEALTTALQQTHG